MVFARKSLFVVSIRRVLARRLDFRDAELPCHMISLLRPLSVVTLSLPLFIFLIFDRSQRSDSETTGLSRSRNNPYFEDVWQRYDRLFSPSAYS
jgi:hypothetical protein